MNGYIALKNVNLSGVEYTAGDAIPSDAVLPSRVPALIRTKAIAPFNDDTDSEVVATYEAHTDTIKVSLNIHTENGVTSLSVSHEDIFDAVEIMQMKANDAVNTIKSVNHNMVLIIVYACDSRATVKKAAKEQIDKLNVKGATDTGGDG